MTDYWNGILPNLLWTLSNRLMFHWMVRINSSVDVIYLSLKTSCFQRTQTKKVTTQNDCVETATKVMNDEKMRNGEFW